MSDFGQHHDDYLRDCLADIIAMLVPDGVTTEVVELPPSVLGRLLVTGPGPCSTGLHTASPGVGWGHHQEHSARS